MPEKLDEEGRLILRRVVESQAWRQLAAMNILGHCLKYVTGIDDKVRVTEQLEASLAIFREVRSLYRELGWTDLESAVRDRLDRIPFPESRLEFSVGRYLCDLAERVALEAYADGISKEFAAIARTYLEHSQKFLKHRYPVFLEFCREEGNRPRAQELFNRWLAIALLSFGRPGTRNDARAVELGLRSRTSADMCRQFFTELEPFLEATGLALPEPDVLGLELPPEFARRAH